jgi:hypothetical protein
MKERFGILYIKTIKKKEEEENAIHIFKKLNIYRVFCVGFEVFPYTGLLYIYIYIYIYISKQYGKIINMAFCYLFRCPWYNDNSLRS